VLVALFLLLSRDNAARHQVEGSAVALEQACA
jgi:hypothetical protein